MNRTLSASTSAAILAGVLFAATASALAMGVIPREKEDEKATLPYARQECRKLRRNERMIWDFTASYPIDFRAYYKNARGGQDVFNKKRVRKDQGSLKAKAKREYCVRWTGKVPSSFVLDYKLSVSW